MITTDDLIHVLTLYDLGTFHSVTPARRGVVNETAFVETNRGRFVVRRNNRRVRMDDQRYRHRLTNWLRDQGCAAPGLIATREGETLVELDGRIYEIHEFVDGEEFDYKRPEQLHSVGGVIAHFQQAIEGFEPPSNQYEPRYSPQNVLALAEWLLQRDAMGELYEQLRWYDLRAAQLRSQVSRDLYAALPHVVIHGDVHIDNFIFKGDEVTALIDYDQATWDARIVDIADALIGFTTATGYEQRMVWGLFRGPLDEDRATRLLSGYLEVSSLTATEIATLPLIVELAWLQGELGRVISTAEGSPEYHQDVLQQGRWLSEWMQERNEALTARWMEANEEVGNAASAIAA